MPSFILDCLVGRSAGRAALLGFAPANVLHALSFADVLDETTGRGYQRRFNSRHSLDFRRYIQQDQSATIPLTFNLRPPGDGAWSIVSLDEIRARLEVSSKAGKVLSQVDCQHRLGHLADLSVELPFMCFIGLTEREEMEVFGVINSKAKGLSASLLDFHDAQLASDLVGDRPELFIALYLNNETGSPWYRQLDLGGNSTSGLGRRASLRTMQKAVKVFLNRTRVLKLDSPEVAARIVLDFWLAVASVLPSAWSKPRKHLLTKGIGVYALMEIAADVCLDAPRGVSLNRHYFAAALCDFATDFDWTTVGPLKGLGGEGGVKAATAIIREARRPRTIRMVVNG
jgi:DNA sulfur modification protein DndB